MKIQNNYQNLYELLKDYNNSDVEPAVKAIGKLSAMFSSLSLDIHKHAISIPRLSLKSLWSSKQPGIEFVLFKDKEELYEMYRNILLVGPVLYFTIITRKTKLLFVIRRYARRFLVLMLMLFTCGQLGKICYVENMKLLMHILDL